MDRELKRINIKKKIIGISFFVLIVVAWLFSFETPNSASFGDIVLRKIALKPWSNGTQGFHYTVIYSFTLFIVAYKGVTYFLKDIFPRFIKRLPFILVILVIFFPSIYSAINKTIKTFSNGINAVDYSREISNCNYKTDSYGNVVLTANLQFENFSDKEVSFHIKLVPSKIFMADIVNMNSITATNLDNDKNQEFVIHSKAVQSFHCLFETVSKKSTTSFQGSMQNLNIIIFTKDKEKQFIKN